MDFVHILDQKEATWNTIFSIFERRRGPPNVAGPGKLSPSPLSTGLSVLKERSCKNHKLHGKKYKPHNDQPNYSLPAICRKRVNTLSASIATRQPRGLPPNVDPCSPGFICNITSSSASIADTCRSVVDQLLCKSVSITKYILLY